MKAYETRFREGLPSLVVQNEYVTDIEKVSNPEQIYQRLLLVGATGFVVIHNHPSGDPTPSGADLEATERLKKQAELMEIAMLDHIIIGGDTFYSIFAKGGGN